MKLIIGGDSRIGSALMASWKENGVKVHASTRKFHKVAVDRPFIDLESLSWSRTFQKYDLAVFCAGVTSVSECEHKVEWSRRVNVVNTLMLVDELMSKTVSVLYLSSTQVFDGSRPFCKPNDFVCPTTQYGRQKVEVEEKLLETGRASILRLSKVEDMEADLLKRWRSSLARGEVIHPYDNIYLAPVKLSKLVSYICSMNWGESIGLQHFETEYQLTYADYARELCRLWGFDENLVNPVTAHSSDSIHMYSSLTA